MTCVWRTVVPAIPSSLSPPRSTAYRVSLISYDTFIPVRRHAEKNRCIIGAWDVSYKDLTRQAIQ